MAVESNDQGGEHSMEDHWYGDIGVDCSFDESKGQRPSVNDQWVWTRHPPAAADLRGFLLEEFWKGIVCVLTRCLLTEGFAPFEAKAIADVLSKARPL